MMNFVIQIFLNLFFSWLRLSNFYYEISFTFLLNINMPKSTFDKNVKKVSAEFDKVADDVKDTAEDIGNRWSRSSTEEKITMILWILLLVRALIKLRMILWGILLLSLWLLLISGFFDRPLRDLIHYCKKEFWSKKKIVTSTAKPTEKKTTRKSK